MPLSVRDDGRVRVEFTHGHRDLGDFDMDAVPRRGDSVAHPAAPREYLIVRNVMWCLDKTEPFVQVQLMTRQEDAADKLTALTEEPGLYDTGPDCGQAITRASFTSSRMAPGRPLAAAYRLVSSRFA
jgi:hypothetical protein